MGIRPLKMQSRLLDTTPNWVSLTFASTSSAVALTGIVVLFGLITPDITPVTLVLHLVWSLAISAWVLNLRVRLPGEKRSLLGLAVAVGLGSAWSSAQQWLGYVASGLLNDPIMVGASTLMDAMGGGITYLLYQFNVRQQRTRQ